MRILQVNKYYYPRGGAERYFLSLAEEQRAAGHEVAVFAMDHPDNLQSPWQSYFVSRLSFNRGTLDDALRTPGRVLYSFEAKRQFRKLLRDFRPDVIHCHNIYHHLSPSILDAAHEAGIPVVMHLHDYKLICANHAMYAEGGHHCDPKKPWPCIKRRCVKDSLAATFLALFEQWLHHDVLRIYERNIAAFVAPSRYMRDLAVRYGQDATKVRIIHNPYDPSVAPNPAKIASGDYLLYFGRLSSEKGVDTLIKAAAVSGWKTKIAGDGPQYAYLKDLAGKLKAPVEFTGHLEAKELGKLIAGADAVILPSIWGENMPLSLLEAMHLGKAVIASRIGGMPEMIRDGENGLLFEPGDSQDLERQLTRLGTFDKEKLGAAARETVKYCSPAKNLEQIMALYQEVLKK